MKNDYKKSLKVGKRPLESKSYWIIAISQSSKIKKQDTFLESAVIEAQREAQNFWIGYIEFTTC